MEFILSTSTAANVFTLETLCLSPLTLKQNLLLLTNANQTTPSPIPEKPNDLATGHSASILSVIPINSFWIICGLLKSMSTENVSKSSTLYIWLSVERTVEESIQ